MTERSKYRPVGMEYLTPKAIERFHTKYVIDDVTGCWNWTGTLAVKGYGRFSIGGRTPVAHRASWTIANGREVPEGLALDHLCRNRGCVNPEHLEVVSEGENISRGTASSASTLRNILGGIEECARGHDMTLPGAWRYNVPQGKRYCRECQEFRRRPTESAPAL